MRGVVMQGDVAQGSEQQKTNQERAQDQGTLSTGHRPAPSAEIARLRTTGDQDIDALLAPDTGAVPGNTRSVSIARDRVANRTAARVAQELPKALDSAAQTAESRADQGAEAVTSVTSSRPGATNGEVTDAAIAAGRRLVPTGLSASEVMKIDGEIAARVRGIAAAAEKRIEAEKAKVETKAEPQAERLPSAQQDGAPQATGEAAKTSAQQQDAVRDVLGIGVKKAERASDFGTQLTPEQQAAQRAVEARAAAEAKQKIALVNGVDPLKVLEEHRQANRLGTAAIRSIYGNGLISQPDAGIPPQRFVRQELTKPLGIASEPARDQQKKRVAA